MTTEQTKFGFTVGDVVTVRRSVGDAPSGDSPGGTYAKPGEKLIVRGFSDWDAPFPIKVSHEWRTDGVTFGVTAQEIERPANEQ